MPKFHGTRSTGIIEWSVISEWPHRFGLVRVGTAVVILYAKTDSTTNWRYERYPIKSILNYRAQQNC